MPISMCPEPMYPLGTCQNFAYPPSHYPTKSSQTSPPLTSTSVISQNLKMQHHLYAADHLNLPFVITKLTGCVVTILSEMPVRKRVMFKAASLCYRSCRLSQSAYLPLASYIPTLHLRSSNSDRLNEPPARIAIGERCFSHYAPHIWNSLPTTIRSADSFKARLKTHLFDTV